MKKLFRIVILFAAAVMILTSAACSSEFEGISVSTVMTVDKSFAGSRVMSAEIPAAVYKEVFKGDPDTLEEFVNSSSPDSMSCSVYQTTGGGALLEVRMDFSSLSEYQSDVSSIFTGIEDARSTPLVSFDYSRSLLKKGYSIRENFTSIDLLCWLSDAITAQHPSLVSSQKEGIFYSGNSSLVLNGETIDLGTADTIRASALESNAFDGISIETTVLSDETISAVIRYYVSSEVVGNLGTKLDTLMNGLVPKGGTLSSSDTDSGGRTYKMKFTSTTSDLFVSAMNKALAANNTSFTTNSEGEGESLSVKETYKLYFDGRYFLDYNDENTSFSITIKVPADHSLESCSGRYGYIASYDSSYSENMCDIELDMSAPDHVTFVMGYIVDLDEINVSSYIHSEINIDRSIAFRLSSEADAFIGESVETSLIETAANWPDNMTVDKQIEDSMTEYVVSFNAGSFDELTRMTREVLRETDSTSGTNSGGQPDSSVTTGGEIDPTQPIKKYFEVTDTINFSKFLKGSNVTEGISYKLTYPLYYTALFNGNTSFENAFAEEQTVSCTTNNKVISVSSTASKLNIEGILVVIIGAVSLVYCVIVLFFFFTPILAFIKDKKLILDGRKLFIGRGRLFLMLNALAIVCLVVMAIRLIFRVY